jgi:hypothetical protein
VTIYANHAHYITHTCPADPQPHVIEVRRRILQVTAVRPCRNPVTIPSGDTITVVDCGRREPYERQCATCRSIVTVVKTTVIHLGWDEPANIPPAPEGYAEQPCIGCGQPLAAVLAPVGHHIGCPPHETDMSAA